MVLNNNDLGGAEGQEGYESLSDYLNENYDSIVIADGLDSAFIGVQSTPQGVDSVVYSLSGILENLMEQGMSYDSAMDHYYYNINGSYYGEGAPIYVDDIHHIEQPSGGWS